MNPPFSGLSPLSSKKFGRSFRDRCCLYIGEIVGALGHYRVVLHMLRFVGLRFIFQFRPFEFYLLDKILINRGSPRDYEILGWCPAGPVLPQGEKVPL